VYQAVAGAPRSAGRRRGWGPDCLRSDGSQGRFLSPDIASRASNATVNSKAEPNNFGPLGVARLSCHRAGLDRRGCIARNVKLKPRCRQCKAAIASLPAPRIPLQNVRSISARSPTAQTPLAHRHVGDTVLRTVSPSGYAATPRAQPLVESSHTASVTRTASNANVVSRHRASIVRSISRQPNTRVLRQKKATGASPPPRRGPRRGARCPSYRFQFPPDDQDAITSGIPPTREDAPSGFNRQQQAPCRSANRRLISIRSRPAQKTDTATLQGLPQSAHRRQVALPECNNARPRLGSASTADPRLPLRSDVSLAPPIDQHARGPQCQAHQGAQVYESSALAPAISRSKLNQATRSYLQRCHTVTVICAWRVAGKRKVKSERFIRWLSGTPGWATCAAVIHGR